MTDREIRELAERICQLDANKKAYILELIDKLVAENEGREQG